MFTDGRQSSGVALTLEVSEDQSFFVVELAEYLVLTQVVTIADTKPDNGTSPTTEKT